MKKIISVIIIMLIVLNSGSVLAEGFSIHSGVKFGMTVEEVKSLEASNGFSPTSEGNNPLMFEGKMAGFNDSSIRYFFDNGSMCSAYYSFHPQNASEAHITLLNTLISKYGEPATESVGDDIKYLNFKTSGDNVLDVYNEFQAFMNCTSEQFTQWVSPIEDGYVSIMLHKFTCMLGDQIYLSYSYVSDGAYNKYMGEKASEAQEKQNALDSDL